MAQAKIVWATPVDSQKRGLRAPGSVPRARVDVFSAQAGQYWELVAYKAGDWSNTKTVLWHGFGPASADLGPGSVPLPGFEGELLWVLRLKDGQGNYKNVELTYQPGAVLSRQYATPGGESGGPEPGDMSGRGGGMVGVPGMPGGIPSPAYPTPEQIERDRQNQSGRPYVRDRSYWGPLIPNPNGAPPPPPAYNPPMNGGPGAVAPGPGVIGTPDIGTGGGGGAPAGGGSKAGIPLGDDGSNLIIPVVPPPPASPGSIDSPESSVPGGYNAPGAWNDSQRAAPSVPGGMDPPYSVPEGENGGDAEAPLFQSLTFADLASGKVKDGDQVGVLAQLQNLTPSTAGYAFVVDVGDSRVFSKTFDSDAGGKATVKDVINVAGVGLAVARVYGFGQMLGAANAFESVARGAGDPFQKVTVTAGGFNVTKVGADGKPVSGGSSLNWKTLALLGAGAYLLWRSF